MTVRAILRLGHPILRSPADPVPTDRIEGPAIQDLVDDLLDTLEDSRGVGLAAPQVGEPLQVFVYRAEEGEPRVLINPMVEPHARELVYDWEGCLSIPGLRGLVPRHPEVRVEALDRHGEAVSFIADGFTARIIQHEFDHLSGVVFLDRMRDFRSLSFEEEWLQYLVPSESDPDPAAVG